MKLFIFILMLTPLVMAQHQVQIKADNAACLTSGTSCGRSTCQCSFGVYRAPCTSATSCPVASNPVAAPFKMLPQSGMSSTIDLSGTHIVYNDTGSDLIDGSVWTYVVTSKWVNQVNPSPESGPSKAAGPFTMPTATGVHRAVLNYSSIDCTTARPCTPQLWRALCSPTTGCPTYSNGFIQLSGAQLAVNQITASGTTWQFMDNDPSLAPNSTYVYVATCCFQSSCSYSSPSATWTGSTNAKAQVVTIRRKR